jgi:hypothetical protein
MIPNILTRIQETSNNKKIGLRFFTAQRMINKLLTLERLEKIEVKRKPYTQEELAKKLFINLSELRAFTGRKTRCTLRKAGAIDLQLIKLYLKTKF